MAKMFGKIKLPGIILLIIVLAASAYAGYRAADVYFRIFDDSEFSSDSVRRIEKGEFEIPPEEENVMNVLLLGVDAENGGGRADSIMLARYNEDTKDVGLVSIPRDTKVELPGRGEEKINHAHAYGGHEYLIKTIENFLEIPIHNYVKVNMTGFKNTIDILGGIEMHVEQDMYHETWKDGEYVTVIDLDAGTQMLDGDKALQYVRWRGGSDGDLGRVERQRELVEKVISDLLHFSSVTRINDLLEEAADNIRTSFDLSEMFSYASSFHNIDWESMESTTLPGETERTDAWYYMVDQQEAKETIKDVIDVEEQQVSVDENEEAEQAVDGD